MSLYQFRLPDIGEGIAEAEIAVWHVKPGDHVAEDQCLVDVMTDKATVDMTSPVEGKVLAIHGAAGEMRPVGAVLVEIEVAGEAEAAAAEPEPAPEPEPTPPPTSEPDIAAPLAAPATRHRARELGIALESVVGTGPGGRITLEDLEPHAHRAEQPRPAPREGATDIPITGLRRKIAERMEQAHQRIPQITYVEECDLTELEALRGEINKEGRDRLTLLPFFIRALVRALPDFPRINAHYDDEKGVLRQYAGVHVGVAVQTPGGLMVPVIRHAETLDIHACARELARLSEAARDGTIRREELSGSTITITSLGPLGGIATTPIINHPEVAIIGPNRIIERPVVQGPFVALRKVMNLSSSFDHRIVDGHDAARFIQHIRRLLEHPALLFMD
ncbi:MULTISPECIES: dihydrolipoamide acetyltransferase family protein [unclassified Novosphingobium]|mgnify:CR=1 FL=1|uniref:dihydrolipoamide acetyltransferase family protein n=1 Tax=unclassified Novosphingobium TaxID=2644732 RepID=UPI00086D6499|nr:MULTISPECIES: dihydrolipoamide acetyltransferase family protein [unclassified Novosphingobium]MBN9145472.1 2-oxo acid dehydrogenase subunit E2 [Novosphingobium sp.]MDR6709787.1 2-oxoisovalerate dehydrogenase E2 component (dihydrolipoyl transacylase) [Novosphingobium sp. 1748]ODU83075.1 MAG: branched-chain alpha-keto acid dehydrogenase subunit E2 [Novosphingobium sp. SCN 63-17]OJX88183.1 MAG: branched-chain alpha-keto acid dehydrogenase subunit E2 [Novosphingobium sp. 63-713]